MMPITNRDPGDETDACDCHFWADGDAEDGRQLVHEIDPQCLAHGHLFEEERLDGHSKEHAWNPQRR